ncbi:MAG: hypothetical protein M0C28_41945 [Candidatus Moduliflexus flocculans]|nr:hypothetical protein [Candidatus Moduliflexus flocculans]
MRLRGDLARPGWLLEPVPGGRHYEYALILVPGPGRPLVPFRRPPRDVLRQARPGPRPSRRPRPGRREPGRRPLGFGDRPGLRDRLRGPRGRTQPLHLGHDLPRDRGDRHGPRRLQLPAARDLSRITWPTGSPATWNVAVLVAAMVLIQAFCASLLFRMFPRIRAGPVSCRSCP